MWKTRPPDTRTGRHIKIVPLSILHKYLGSRITKKTPSRMDMGVS